MIELSELGKGFAGWAEENSGLAVDENFEYTDRTVGNFAAAAFAAGAQWQSQREPTEAEIEAAAISAYKYYFDSRGNTITLEIARHDVQRFNGPTDEFSDPDVNYARNIATAVLTAARKAVTGDE